MACEGTNFGLLGERESASATLARLRDSEADLRIPPSNRFEHLKGALRSRCSIRINDPFRVVFTWSPGVAADVQLVDYHR